MLPSSRRTWLSEQRPARLPGKAPSRLRSRVVRLRENRSSVLLRVSCAEHSDLWFSPHPHRLQIQTHALIGVLTKFHLVSSISVGFHAGPCVFICEPDESLRSFKVFRLLDAEAYLSELRSEPVRESRPVIQLCFLVAL